MEGEILRDTLSVERPEEVRGEWIGNADRKRTKRGTYIQTDRQATDRYSTGYGVRYAVTVHKR